MTRGFSLIELSIVLVILGLITGGILAGQSLIRASELRSVVSETHAFQTAVVTFRDQYLALPGDIDNAGAFWGYAGGTTGTDAACYGSTTATGTETCNGDGDGDITQIGNAAGEYNEMFMFWQHLANAGLIEGSYTGMAGSLSSADHEIGENCPRSKAGSTTGWTAIYRSPNASMYQFDAQNTLQLGTEGPTGTTYEDAFTPEELWNIDSKVDDGKPAYGKVLAHRWSNCTLSTSGTDYDKDYNLANTDIACTLLLLQPF